MNYPDKLKDPRWQQKRLRIFERDSFACRNCKDTTTSLTVHHLGYLPNVEPWDHPDVMLLTLCEPCHESTRQYSAEAKASRLTLCLLEELRRSFCEQLDLVYTKEVSLNLDCVTFLLENYKCQ